MIEIYKNKPPKNIYVPMRSYQNIEFKQKYSIKLLEKFFKEFPEEKRGRKKFKQKEIQNVRHLLYERVFHKATKINASCIGLIREKVDKELVIIKVSFFKING